MAYLPSLLSPSCTSKGHLFSLYPLDFWLQLRLLFHLLRFQLPHLLSTHPSPLILPLHAFSPPASTIPHRAYHISSCYCPSCLLWTLIILSEHWTQCPALSLQGPVLPLLSLLFYGLLWIAVPSSTPSHFEPAAFPKRTYVFTGHVCVGWIKVTASVLEKALTRNPKSMC